MQYRQWMNIINILSLYTIIDKQLRMAPHSMIISTKLSEKKVLTTEERTKTYGGSSFVHRIIEIVQSLSQAYSLT